MPHDDPAERLEELLDGAESTTADADLLQLVEISAVVRLRASRAFRTRLRTDLERTIIMTTATTQGEGSVTRDAGISYMHIPARDPRLSASFYNAVFGWELRGDPDHPSFNDGTGHVIGAWVTDVEPVENAGVLPYVFVDSVDAALDRVVANGGRVLRDPYPEGEGDSPLWVATFRDPAGNTIGVWQTSPRNISTRV
jgi:uncharacterized protein